MKKLNPRLLIPLAILVLTAIACGAPSAILGNFEKGDIKIVNPTDGAQFHEDDLGTGLTTALSVTSTFETDKDATYYNNNIGPYGCRLLANQTTTCAVLLVTGENTIRMSVPKGNSISESSVVVSWVPYAPMDKWMGSVAGIFSKDGSKFGNPVIGYGMVLILLAFAGTILLGLVFGQFGAGSTGGIVGFFMTLVIAAIYFNAAGNTILAGQVLTLIYSIIAVTITAFVLYHMINRGYMFSTGGYVSISDGDRNVTMGAGPALGPGERVSSPERMMDAASKMFEQPQQQTYLPYQEDYPQLQSGGRRQRRGLARLILGK